MAARQSSYQPYVERASPTIDDDRRLADLLNEQTAFESLLPDLEEFIGRQTEMQQAMALWQQLQQLHAAAETPTAESAAEITAIGTTPVLAIVGQAGVGKSAFARRLVERINPIPTASLYFNLRSDRSVAPAVIVQQIQRFLAETGDDPRLILLDNLEDPALIPPLLTLGGCTLLVTSRQFLDPTIAAATLELPALLELDAVALLQSIANSRSMQADYDLTRSIVHCCDALPLALRIMGGLLQTQPQLRLDDCLQRLQQERQRCEQARLSYAAVRACFNLSCHYLDARSTRLLRLLGLLPAPTVTLKTAAALSETSIYFARDSIDHLLRVRLLESTGRERYHLSDLLRLLAKGQLAIEESAETRQAARLRLCQTYQETAEVISLGLDARSRQQLTRIYGRGHASFEQDLLLNAQSWFAAERSNLLTAIDWAWQAEDWTIGLEIVKSLTLFLALRREWTEVEALLLRAISMAEKLADHLQTGQLLNHLGNVYLQQGEWEKAKAPYQRSLELLHDLQEPRQESQTLANLGIVYLEQGDRETAATLWSAALTRLPTGSTPDRHLTQWMRSTHESLLETVLFQLDDRHQSHKFLDAIGSMFKRLLS